MSRQCSVCLLALGDAWLEPRLCGHLACGGCFQQWRQGVALPEERCIFPGCLKPLIGAVLHPAEEDLPASPEVPAADPDVHRMAQQALEVSVLPAAEVLTTPPERAAERTETAPRGEPPPKLRATVRKLKSSQPTTFVNAPDQACAPNEQTGARPTTYYQRITCRRQPPEVPKPRHAAVTVPSHPPVQSALEEVEESLRARSDAQRLLQQLQRARSRAEACKASPLIEAPRGDPQIAGKCKQEAASEAIAARHKRPRVHAVDCQAVEQETAGRIGSSSASVGRPAQGGSSSRCTPVSLPCGAPETSTARNDHAVHRAAPEQLSSAQASAKARRLLEDPRCIAQGPPRRPGGYPSAAALLSPIATGKGDPPAIRSARTVERTTPGSGAAASKRSRLFLEEPEDDSPSPTTPAPATPRPKRATLQPPLPPSSPATVPKPPSLPPTTDRLCSDDNVRKLSTAARGPLPPCPPELLSRAPLHTLEEVTEALDDPNSFLQPGMTWNPAEGFAATTMVPFQPAAFPPPPPPSPSTLSAAPAVPANRSGGHHETDQVLDVAALAAPTSSNLQTSMPSIKAEPQQKLTASTISTIAKRLPKANLLSFHDSFWAKLQGLTVENAQVLTPEILRIANRAHDLKEASSITKAMGSQLRHTNGQLRLAVWRLLGNLYRCTAQGTLRDDLVRCVRDTSVGLFEVPGTTSAPLGLQCEYQELLQEWQSSLPSTDPLLKCLEGGIAKATTQRAAELERERVARKYPEFHVSEGYCDAVLRKAVALIGRAAPGCDVDRVAGKAQQRFLRALREAHPTAQRHLGIDFGSQDAGLLRKVVWKELQVGVPGTCANVPTGRNASVVDCIRKALQPLWKDGLIREKEAFKVIVQELHHEFGRCSHADIVDDAARQRIHELVVRKTIELASHPHTYPAIPP